MATTTYSIDSTYTDLDIDADTVYIHAKGSQQVELYIGNSAPAQTDEGVPLTMESPGVTITLTGGDTIYAKTEAHSATSTIVCVY